MNFNVLDYWNAIKEKTGDSRFWNSLQPQEQQMVIQSINLLIQVLMNDPKAQDAQP